MKPRSGFWRRLTAPLVVCATSLAMVGIAVPSAGAAQASAAKTVPVQELSSVVLQLIKVVEDTDAVACETRNSVVRRLRELDDALLSGRRSAAQALASAWRQDAWSMEAARVIGPELGSSIQNRLSRLQGKVGSGFAVKPGPTRHWKPLPSCETGGTNTTSSTGVLAAATGTALVGSYNPTVGHDRMTDLKILLKMALGLAGLLNYVVPGLGTMISSIGSGLVEMLWPAGTGPNTANLFQDLVDTTTYNQFKTQVDYLGGEIGGIPGGWNDLYVSAKKYCVDNGGFGSAKCIEKSRTLWAPWWKLYSDFLGDRAAFQGATNQVNLLPVFAQYENLFLGLLHDGIELHPYWADRTTENSAWVDLDYSVKVGGPVPLVAMDQELNPTYMDRGIGYVNSVYRTGLNQQPVASKDDWGERNKWVRERTLDVLDFRDMWKYFDPRAYPDGVPGGVKLTRMIYSDSWGQRQATPSLPTNVSGPLREISIWTKGVSARGDAARVISSVQSTSPPTLGPAQSGPITGTGVLPHNVAIYKNLADATCSGTTYTAPCAGPIISVKVGRDRNSAFHDFNPSAIQFNYAAGGSSTAGYWSVYPEDVSPTFQYDGEVLATVQVVHRYHWSDSVGNVADAVVFGFRDADSFYPTGQAIAATSGRCLNAPQWSNGQVTISDCNQPTTPGQIWTYEPDLGQISVTDPTVNPADNANDVQARYCLDTAGGRPGGGGSVEGTSVVVNPCDDGARFYDSTTDTWLTSSQRWTIAAVGGGFARITNDKSGLVLDLSTSNGQLSAYDGRVGQQWTAHDPLTGEIHGISSGKCLDVPNYSTTPGTQVQIYDCHGNWAQQWTYKPTTRQLIYTAHPSLCLEVRGGGGAGAPVQINLCNGWPRQEWILHGDGSTITSAESGLVLDVTGGSTENNALVQIWSSNGSQAQQWSRTANRGGAVFAVGAGKCLDLPSSWNDDSQAVIRTCSSPLTAAQTWTYHPIAQTFTVNSPSGPKCLDTRAGGTAEHTAVVIKPCSDAASQRWTLNFARSAITNVNSITYFPDHTVSSAMVLGVHADGTADGAPVELTQSVDANGDFITPTPGQQWVWSLN